MELYAKLDLVRVKVYFTSLLATVVWPPTLEVLILRQGFDHSIGGADEDASLLPNGLEELHLGMAFDRSIDNVRLPKGLKRLVLGKVIFPCSDMAWPVSYIASWLGGAEAVQLLQSTHRGHNLP